MTQVDDKGARVERLGGRARTTTAIAKLSLAVTVVAASRNLGQYYPRATRGRVDNVQHTHSTEHGGSGTVRWKGVPGDELDASARVRSQRTRDTNTKEVLKPTC